VELPFTGFDDDVAAVVRAVESSAEPVVLCGHSYGGAVITQAGNHQKVRELIYLCAFAVEEGYSTPNPFDAELPATGVPPGIRFGDGDDISFDPALARETFYSDVADDVIAAACRHLRPMSMSSLAGTVTQAAWRSRPSLYVVCTQDSAIHPSAQRMMATHCDETVEWASSHSPFLSMPDTVAELLRDRAQRPR
jgi:pimeloyl-ACP methyl ester carboxylesterase